jgi:hypothetical protein
MNYTGYSFEAVLLKTARFFYKTGILPVSTGRIIRSYHQTVLAYMRRKELRIF